MDKQVVIDSSIALKWFIDEKDSSEARAIFQRHIDEIISIFAPYEIILEVINALYYRADFDNRKLQTVVETLFQAELNFASLNNSLALLTAEMMMKHNIASYDALFIALSQQLDSPLFTADKKHHQKKYSKRIKYLDEI